MDYIHVCTLDLLLVQYTYFHQKDWRGRCLCCSEGDRAVPEFCHRVWLTRPEWETRERPGFVCHCLQRWLALEKGREGREGGREGGKREREKKRERERRESSGEVN